MHETTARIIPTHLAKILHSSSTLCLAVVFHRPSTWCEHRSRSQWAGFEEALSATLAALGDVKESCVGLSQNNCHACVNSLPSGAKTNAPTNTYIISPRCWHTFHYYIKVVVNFSSRVFSYTLVFPLITLFYSRDGQELSKAKKFCPCRQLVSQFHPFHCRSGATTWNNDMLWAVMAD